MSNRKERKPLPYSPNAYGTSPIQGSPSKASLLLQQDHTEYVQSLIARKENFCTCLQLYKVSFQNDLPQKCLIHNNFITLYCENEFKLLCVNCIYQNAIHTSHRVVPSKNSIMNISRDNEDNLKILEEELERIKHVDVEMRQNKKVLEDQYRNILQQLDDQFKIIYKMLDEKHASLRQSVVEAFTNASGTNDKAIKEMGWWRELLAKTRVNLPKSSLGEEAEIYKHLVLDLFLQEKIDQQKLTYISSGAEMRDMFLRRSHELREIIESAIGPTYAPEKSKMRMF